MKIFGNRTASGAVSDFKRDPSSRFKRDEGLLFVVAIHPIRNGVSHGVHPHRKQCGILANKQ